MASDAARSLWGGLRRAVASAVWLAVICAPAAAQVGFDRYGGDYANFTVPSGDPAVCAQRCEREGRCRAWSFTYPSANGAAVCWLKNRVPARVANPFAVSGVKGAAIRPTVRGPIEFSTDRYGGDLRNFEIAPDPSGESCAAACRAEPRCRAFTYLRPGYGGAAARCFLKDRITRPRHRPCCIAGVIR